MNEALSEHLSAEIAKSDAPFLDGSFRAKETYEDPGYLNFKIPDQAQLSSLAQKVEQGQLPEFNSVRLM